MSVAKTANRAGSGSARLESIGVIRFAPPASVAVEHPRDTRPQAHPDYPRLTGTLRTVEPVRA